MSELNVKTTDLVYAYFDNFAHSNINTDGTVIDGKIISIDHKKGIVVVDDRIKTDGIIPLKEIFKKDEEKNLNIGDTVKV